MPPGGANVRLRAGHGRFAVAPDASGVLAGHGGAGSVTGRLLAVIVTPGSILDARARVTDHPLAARRVLLKQLRRVRRLPRLLSSRRRRVHPGDGMLQRLVQRGLAV